MFSVLVRVDRSIRLETGFMRQQRKTKALHIQITLLLFDLFTYRFNATLIARFFYH